MTTRTSHRLITFVLVSITGVMSACGSQATEAISPTPALFLDPPTTETIPPTPALLLDPPTTETIPPTPSLFLDPPTNTPAPAPILEIPADLEPITHQNWNRLHPIVVLPHSGVWGLEFSPNSQYLVMGTGRAIEETPEVVVYDLNTGQDILTLSSKARIYFNPNNTSAAVLEGSELVEYDLRTGQAIAGYNSKYQVGALSPDGHWLAVIADVDSVKQETTIKIIDLKTEAEIHTFYIDATITARDLQFSPDGEILVATYSFLTNTGGDTYSTFWDVSTGEVMYTLYDYDKIAFNPTEPQIAATFPDQGHISIIDTNTSEQIRYLGSGGSRRYYTPKYTSSGALVYARYDGEARFWDPSTGEYLGFINLPMSISSVSISPDSKLLATAEENPPGMATIWGIIP